MALKAWYLVLLMSISACVPGKTPIAYSAPKPKTVIDGVRVWVDLDTSEVRAILRLPALASERGIGAIFPDKTGPQASESAVDTVRVHANRQWDSSLDSYGVEYRVARDRDSNWVIIETLDWVE